MATTSNVPPQAYTRDILVKAIEWMATQPQAVRERANSADLIVSYYLQARRRMTAAQMEAPISGESFKADLKHLAQDLKQFEEPSAPPTQPSRCLSHGPFDHLSEIDLPTPQQQSPSAPKVVTWTVDPRSLAVARELQQRMNLSSETEAIRMLITMGAERARAIFP
jgi:hypothetical protein